MTEWTTFLDMDEVCVDFRRGALRAHGREDLADSWTSWLPPIGPGTDAEIGEEEFWKVIDAQGVDFWRGLDAFPWFWELYRGLEKLGKVIFLSKPSRSPHSLAGKLLWLYDRFDSNFNDYVFTAHKHYCASTPNSCLVDDRDENLDVKVWPRGALFPRPWNEYGRQPRIGDIEMILSRVDVLRRTVMDV